MKKIMGIILITGLLVFSVAGWVSAYSLGKIVYTDAGDIWMMDDDGTNFINLTNSATDSSPIFSPDGSTIAYADITNNKIMVMNSDGTSKTAIYTTSGPSAHLSDWSPDGSTILFRQGPYNYYDLWTINPDGSGAVNLTNDTMFGGGNGGNRCFIFS